MGPKSSLTSLSPFYVFHLLCTSILRSFTQNDPTLTKTFPNISYKVIFFSSCLHINDYGCPLAIYTWNKNYNFNTILLLCLLFLPLLKRAAVHHSLSLTNGEWSCSSGLKVRKNCSDPLTAVSMHKSLGPPEG